MEKVLLKRGRLAAGAAALESAGMRTSLPDFVLATGLVAVGAGTVGALAGVVAAVVLAVSAGLVAGLGTATPGLPLALAEAFGHGVGIAAGAVANYFGHRLLTFSPRSREAQTL